MRLSTTFHVMVPLRSEKAKFEMVTEGLRGRDYVLLNFRPNDLPVLIYESKIDVSKYREVIN